MGFEFTLVDVFSDRPFGGNRLAVFPDAEGISETEMQSLAREFNFPETTFVLPPSDPSNTCRVRIFTPLQELPFAGHPTIGTAAVLASLGKGDAQRQFVLEEGIGPVSVAIDGRTVQLCLRSPEYETADETPPVDAITKALGLPPDSVAESFYASVGVRFCFVRLTDRDLVDRAVLDRAAWEAGIADGWSPHLYVFAEDNGDRRRLNARMFAPALGIDEDPATGSACAALVAAIAHRSPNQDATCHVQIDQGLAMGRPSSLEGTARKEEGRLAEVTVGGHATIIGNGVMTLPAI
ncbi:PhzF family phenazine biosynthesis protein [Spirillospora sp. NPDC127506]|jgi:trans-2,3-dihydro-3-hydroxyanthranilate isomerase